MSDFNSRKNAFYVGFNGGTVDTNGMSFQQKQATDAARNAGAKAAGRR